MFSSTWKELLTFLKAPKENPDIQESQLSAPKLAVAAYLIFLIPVFISSISAVLADQMGVINIDNHEVVQMLEQFPKAVVIVMAVVLAPFWEELFFRLPLRWQRAYLFRILLFPIYLGRSSAFTATQEKVKQWWKRRYGFIFYAVASTFALIHIFNYTIEGPMWQFVLWTPLLILPQLILGILLGFIRLRLGFWWALLTHAAHNFIFVGIALLAPQEDLPETGYQEPQSPPMELSYNKQDEQAGTFDFWNKL